MAPSRQHFRSSSKPQHVLCAALLVAVATFFVAGVNGCSKPAPSQQPQAGSIVEHALDDAPDGLSGLALDPSGMLWSVAESGILVQIDPKSGKTRSIPAKGLPDDIELESVTFLENGDLLLGTEGELAGRDTDALFLARRDGTLYEQVNVDYDMWKLDPPRNQGIEGVCVSGDWLVVAAEPPTRIHGRRFAALALYQLSTKTWRPLRLALTSKVGKVSGITCREVAQGIELIAIERHFGVCRIIRTIIEPTSEATSMVSEVILDLSKRRENFEGVTWLDDSTLALVTDNFYGGTRFGPGRLVFVTVRR